MEILGLSTSPSSGDAYALILAEAEGSRRLPIIIGAFEAQAIALELENIKPPRPMTHDLIRNMIMNFDAGIKHVLINDLSDGTFYARIVLERGAEVLEVDSRPSDAIAVSVRFGAPIYVSEHVLKEAGIIADAESEADTTTKPGSATVAPTPAPGDEELSKLEQLENQLKSAIMTENYEKAAQIRDQIQKIRG